jgi:hypothetical protein
MTFEKRSKIKMIFEEFLTLTGGSNDRSRDQGRSRKRIPPGPQGGFHDRTASGGVAARRGIADPR